MAAGQAWLPAIDPAATKPMQVEHLSFLPFSGILPRIEEVVAAGRLSRPRPLRHAGDACRALVWASKRHDDLPADFPARSGKPVRKKKVPEAGVKDAHRDARGACSWGSEKSSRTRRKGSRPWKAQSQPRHAQPKLATGLAKIARTNGPIDARVCNRGRQPRSIWAVAET